MIRKSMKWGNDIKVNRHIAMAVQESEQELGEQQNQYQQDKFLGQNQY